MKEQNEDKTTIQPIWRDLRQNDSTIYVVEEDILYKKGTDKVGQEIFRLVVPSSKRGQLLKLSHTSLADVHFGRNRTLERLHRSFFWPGMTADVRSFVKECVECQKGNVGKQDRVPMEMMPVVQTPFEIFAADIVRPLPITVRRNRYILTIMDLSTRYPEATPLKQATSTAVIDAMLEFFYRIGYPVKILTDNSTNFTSKLMSEVCKRLRIERIHTSPYHPQTNGALERWHATLKSMERKTGQGVTEWDRLLGPSLFTYRDSVHEATGFTPFQLLLGEQFEDH